MNFQALRKNLLEQVEEVFPAETEAYRDIRSQSSVVSTITSHLRFNHHTDYIFYVWN
jgi:hypothetical protein